MRRKRTRPISIGSTLSDRSIAAARAGTRTSEPPQSAEFNDGVLRVGIARGGGGLIGGGCA